ncbi:thymidine kinase-like protein [Phocid alphaherpesvirus 1]|uniref:Thymidine kinase-like protein n=1 Tax=Phocid alphaherpesvirus 1 TaxID=47418 RepID=A0A482F4J1_9ALPH|nr:thymidine kinase-like protein [Phocid alphaherpesvirus 1]QBN85142.1 thymidine kinase-like protein [Phocid alphaherpesvirus 1]
MGKSTTAHEILKSKRTGPVYYFPEPMAYWRTILEMDVVEGIYSVQDRKQCGELSQDDASLITAQYQTRFSTPYLLLHAKVFNLFGREINSTEPELTFIFDRHPIASTVCFPLARYFVGDMSLGSIISIMTTLPKEPPGGNLIITTLDEDEHLRRLKKRSRKGEKIDLRLLRALRNVYTMLVNTKRFLELNDWRTTWNDLSLFTDYDKKCITEPPFCLEKENPSINDTIFKVFKTQSLLNGDGNILNVYEWALDKFADSLHHLKIFRISLKESPDVCASGIYECIPHMTITSTSIEASKNLVKIAEKFSDEMYCG